MLNKILAKILLLILGLILLVGIVTCAVLFLGFALYSLLLPWLGSVLSALSVGVVLLISGLLLVWAILRDKQPPARSGSLTAKDAMDTFLVTHGEDLKDLQRWQKLSLATVAGFISETRPELSRTMVNLTLEMADEEDQS